LAVKISMLEDWMASSLLEQEHGTLTVEILEKA
jgi:hypothetical protein